MASAHAQPSTGPVPGTLDGYILAQTVTELQDLVDRADTMTEADLIVISRGLLRSLRATMEHSVRLRDASRDMYGQQGDMTDQMRTVTAEVVRIATENAALNAQVSQMATQVTQLTSQMNTIPGSFHTAISAMRDTLRDTFTAAPSQSGTVRSVGILESRAIANVGKLSDDKSMYRQWSDKFVNAVGQCRINGRDALLYILAAAERNKIIHDEVDWNHHIWQEDGTGGRQVNAFAQTRRYQEFSEDLYCVLIEKCEGEALARVKSSHGNGIKAMGILHKWFTGVAGMAITQRTQNLMKPTPPKSPHQIADAVDKWVEGIHQLAKLGKSYQMSAPFKIEALKSLMVGTQAKSFLEHLGLKHKPSSFGEEDMETLYEEYLDEIREFATRVRLTEQVKKDSNDMDTSPLDGENEDQASGTWGSWGDDWTSSGQECDMDALGKGKGGKKGKKGKGKTGGGYTGKGQGNGSASSSGQSFTGRCNHCGITGHKAADCRRKLGQCFICGETGHVAANCSRSRGDSKRKPLNSVDPGDNSGGEQANSSGDKRESGCNIGSLELGGGIELDHRDGCNLSSLAVDAVDKPGYRCEELEMTVDSGAADTVIPTGRLPHVPVEPSAASKRGLKYTAASGHKMPNRGQQRVTGVTSDGREVKLLLQVTDVNKALCSVRQMCEANNRVVFEKGGSYIQNRDTGVKTAIYETDGVYKMKLNIKTMGVESEGKGKSLNTQIPTRNRFQPLSDLLTENEETICHDCDTMVFSRPGRHAW